MFEDYHIKITSWHVVLLLNQIRNSLHTLFNLVYSRDIHTSCIRTKCVSAYLVELVTDCFMFPHLTYPEITRINWLKPSPISGSIRIIYCSVLFCWRLWSRVYESEKFSPLESCLFQMSTVMYFMLCLVMYEYLCLVIILGKQIVRLVNTFCCEIKT